MAIKPVFKILSVITIVAACFIAGSLPAQGGVDLGDLDKLLDKFDDELDTIFDFDEEQVYSPYLLYSRFKTDADAADKGYPKVVSDETWPGLYVDLVTAGVNWGNGKAYIFGFNDESDDHLYARYDIKTDKTDKGYPYPVTQKYWPDLGMDYVTAALNWGNGKVYLFGKKDGKSGMYYTRWGVDSATPDEGYPMVVNSKNWPGVTLDDITAAVNWGDGKAYFFGYYDGYHDMYYIRYDIKADKADEGYPKPVNGKTWPGLDLDYISGAVNWGNGNVYFFGFNE